MNCPKCKYPNQPGTRFCGLCYEVLTHSAAEAYLRSVRREHREEKAKASEVGRPPAPLESAVSSASEAVKQIDWAGLFREAAQTVKRFRKALLYAAATVAALFAAQTLGSPRTWFHLLGSRLAYRVPPSEPLKYLVGFHYDLNVWSQRQGRLDTPIQRWRLDELGNALLENATMANPSGERLVAVRPQEWIQIAYHGDLRQSRALPLDHPSLAAASVPLDRRGSALKRNVPLSPRLSKSVNFLMPRFPPERLRRGRAWEEPVEWIETIGDWKIHWSGRLRWTLEGQKDCGRDACAHLLYKADLRPQIWEAPQWAAGALGRPSYEGTAQGDALFDHGRRRLYANSLKHEGVIRIPFSDLGAIPRRLRVGRKVRGPGEIVLQLAHRIDIK